jgi:hypothetical protein
MNWLNFGGRDMRNKRRVATTRIEIDQMARQDLKEEKELQLPERYGLLGRQWRRLEHTHHFGQPSLFHSSADRNFNSPLKTSSTKTGKEPHFLRLKSS